MTVPSSVMVRLVAGMPNDALLALAADVAVRLKVPRVIGISARQPLQIYGSVDMYIPPDLVEQDFEQIDKELKSAESEFRGAFQGKAAELEWRSTIASGPVADYIAEQMRAADLLVTAVDESGARFDWTRHVDVADLVLRTGRPALVAAPDHRELDLRHVVVAWKETREARRAVLDAVPLLRLADRVSVVEIAADEALGEARMRTEDVVRWLASKGISASARPVAAAGGHAGQLRDVVGEFDLDAGLVVGGAYGHARLREWILGGVTRDLLLRPPRCSFLSH